MIHKSPLSPQKTTTYADELPTKFSTSLPLPCINHQKEKAFQHYCPAHFDPMNQSPTERGCSLITGVIVLENGRILDEEKQRLLTFDGHIYVPGKFGTEPDELLAVVRFFARNDAVFSPAWPDIGPCFIHAMVRNTTIVQTPTDAI